MRPKTNRLLMLLIGAMLAGCASQTERSSSGGGAEQAPAPAPTPAPAPAYEPKSENVQFVDRPLEETPPPPPAPVAKAPEQPLPDFPITKYEVEPEEEVGDLGTQPEESAAADYSEEELAAKDSVVGEPSEVADEEEEEVADLGTQPDDSGTMQYPEEDLAAMDSVVGEPTQVADEPEEEVGDLGTQPDDSGTMQYPEEDLAAMDSMVGEPTQVADEPEEEVGDLGTQPDESGTMSYPEQQLASEKVISEPKQYPDEPVAKAPVRVSFDAEPLFSFDKSVVRSDQRGKLDEFVASLKGAKYDSISVIGYADRIGTEKYNQKLSERRANAVKTYLVRQGVPAGKINAEGRGESGPVTGDTCSRQRGKALIACLEPDRRVDVSVTATKASN
jgi:outer membrane protein OmpA-like peptidoglycan-associated protein